MNEELLKTFQCIICLECAQNAVQSECCGNIFCQTCCSSYKAKCQKCPICNAQDYKTNASKKIRRVIAQLLVECRHQCGRKVENRQRKLHESTCVEMRLCFKDTFNAYNLITGLLQFWRNLKYSEPSTNQELNQNLQKLCFVIEEMITRILRSFYQLCEGNDPQYWQFLIQQKQDLQQVGAFILDLAYIFYLHKNYKESIEHCTKALQLPISIARFKGTLYLISHSAEALLNEKSTSMNTYKQCIKILFTHVSILEIEDANYVLYLTYENLLLRLQNKIESEEEEIIAMKLSSDQAYFKTLVGKKFQKLCRDVNRYDQFKTFKLNQDEKKHLSQLGQDIQCTLQKIILILSITHNHQYLYKLFSSSSQIFSKPELQISHILPQMAQNCILKTLISILQRNIEIEIIQKQQQQQFNIFQYINTQKNILLNFQLLCYTCIHRSFNGKNIDRSMIQLKMRTLISIFFEYEKQNNPYINSNKIQQIKYLEQYIINGLKNLLNYMVGIIGKHNLNLKNICMIKYIIEDIQIRKMAELNQQKLQKILVLYYFYSQSQQQQTNSQVKQQQKQQSVRQTGKWDGEEEIKQKTREILKHKSLTNRLDAKIWKYHLNKIIEGATTHIEKQMQRIISAEGKKQPKLGINRKNIQALLHSFLYFCMDNIKQSVPRKELRIKQLIIRRDKEEKSIAGGKKNRN